MADINAFKFQEQQDYLSTMFGSKYPNLVWATTAFVSGTTKNTADGFKECRKGTILITVVSSTTTVYFITAVASDGTLTGTVLNYTSA